MIPLIVLLLIVALFGGLGFAVHALWGILILLLLLWVIGFAVRAATPPGGRRPTWYRW